MLSYQLYNYINHINHTSLFRTWLTRKDPYAPTEQSYDVCYWLALSENPFGTHLVSHSTVKTVEAVAFSRQNSGEVGDVRCPKGLMESGLMSADFFHWGDYYDASQHPQQVHAKFAPPGCNTCNTGKTQHVQHGKNTTHGAAACCQSWNWLVSLKMYEV